MNSQNLAVAKEEARIGAMADRLEKTLIALGETVVELENRLAPALSVAPKSITDNTKQGEGPPEESPLFYHLQTLDASAIAINYHVKELLERLQL